MDDPWGSSPWADELQLPTPNTIKEHAPRPTTPVQAPTLRLEERFTSPWGDDDDNDGFEDWAAHPGDQEQTSGQHGTADGWGKHLTDAVDLTNGHSNELFVDWDAHHVTDAEEPLNLAPSPFSGVRILMPQPSPDPWALASQEGEGQLESAEIEDRQEEPTGDIVTILGNERLDSNATLVPGQESEEEETATLINDTPEDMTSNSPDTEEHLQVTLDGESRLEGQENDPVSRPSSSPSERSHRDELLQETPRTSFDEEPKPTGSQVQRKVSKKIHELVQHSDTLVKQEDTEPVIRQTNGAQDAYLNEYSEEEDDQDGEDDFGDFEEGQSGDEVPEVDNSPASEQNVSQSPSTGMPQRQTAPSTENALTKDYGIVEYKPDLSKLESIFPSDTPESTSERIFIMDSVPFDSFSSTEQRKSWYRISRYGSMRKHNSGNDENYVRVSWKSSKIREDTLKIVSRWIEEDRISGRVVLGGGSKGSTVFGWNDPKAPAVPISDAFVKHGKKMANMNASAEVAPDVPREWPKGLDRDHSTSKIHFPSGKPQREGSFKAASTPVSSDIDKNPVAPVANFGWNSGTRATKANVSSSSSGMSMSGIATGSAILSNQTSPPRHPTSSHKSISSTLPAAQDFLSQNASPSAVVDTGPPLAPAQKSIPLPSLSMSTVDDDDYWGEMVSTPATPTLHVIPPSKGLHREESQSFGGMSSNQAPETASKIWMDDQQHTGHRLTASFDEILVPPTMSSKSNISQITSNVDLFPARGDIFKSPGTAQSLPTSTASDPWASEDFSFFEKTPAPAPAPAPAPKSMHLPASKATGSKSVKFTTPPRSSPRGNQKSREELDLDRIVQSIVDRLPDLSYMLKK